MISFFSFHSNFVEKNNLKKLDVQQILIENSTIKKDHLNRYYLVYNQQFIRIIENKINCITKIKG